MYSFLLTLDTQIFQLINLSYHNIILNNLAVIVSYFGTLGVIALILLLFLFFDKRKGKKIAILLLIGAVLSVIFVWSIKYSILRPRPYTVIPNVVLLGIESDSSFPSGHSVNSAYMAYILAKECNNKYFLIIPILVGLSRIYMGVHYPSDVLCGILLGILIAIISEYIFDRFFHDKKFINIRKTLKD